MSRNDGDSIDQRAGRTLWVVLLAAFVSALVALLTIAASQWATTTVPPQGQWWSAVTIPIALFTILVPLLGYGIRRYTKMLRLSKQGLSQMRQVTDQYRSIIPAIIGSQYTFETGNETPRLMQTLRTLFGNNDDPRSASSLIRQLSTVAWRHGQEDLCYEIRKLAYDLDPSDSWNRTYLVSILPEVGKGTESAILGLVSGIDELDEDAVLMGGSVLGKYYMSVGSLDKAVSSCENPALQRWNNTSIRSYCLSLACLGRWAKLREAIEYWESQSGATERRMQPKSQDVFSTLLKAFCGSLSISQFWEQLHPGLILDAPRMKNYYDRTSCFNVFKNLRRRLGAECLDAYLVFYWLYGVKDSEADSELGTKGTWHRLFSGAVGLY